jgi:hypothetical protein
LLALWILIFHGPLLYHRPTLVRKSCGDWAGRLETDANGRRAYGVA